MKITLHIFSIELSAEFWVVRIIKREIVSTYVEILAHTGCSVAVIFVNKHRCGLHKHTNKGSGVEADVRTESEHLHGAKE